MIDEALDALDTWLRESRRVALATVTAVTGSAPREPGAKLAISEDGQLAGSVSGGCVEGAVVEAVAEVLRADCPRLLHYGISDEMALDVGLMCGGEIDVLLEPATGDAAALLEQLVALARSETPAARIVSEQRGTELVATDDECWGTGDPEPARAALAAGRSSAVENRFVDLVAPPPRAWVVGAGHVAEHLVRMLPSAGFRPIVIDPRRLFADQERFSGSDVQAAWPDRALAGLQRGDAVVVLSHDPKIDEPALLAALHSDVSYVGAIGSRRAQADRVERLRTAGIGEADLARIHAPIGLDLGGRAPGEIAVAIAAELVAHRHSGAPGGQRGVS